MDEYKALTDLSLIAYLHLMGIRPVGTYRVGRLLHFNFEPSLRLEQEISKFYTRSTSVDALTVLETFRTFTTQAREMRR